MFHSLLCRIAIIGGFALNLKAHGESRKQGTWEINDVSILFPLPKSLENNTDGLLRPTHGRSRGQLLPKVIFDALPSLAFNAPGDATMYESLRAVAVRIDPRWRPD